MSEQDQPVQRFPRWLETFIPTKEVAVTPILISANVIVWLIMIATGVSPFMPTVDDVLKWGANSSEAIGDGQYWRLWTSNYLHYGLLHLAVNMLSLNNVGRLLERFIGKWRFALLYTITGIFASSVSIWWNKYSVGVGASGAILGIVGVLTAILTTNLIDKSVRWQMLRSIGFSILLMLLIGLNANIDNAAHLGGLLAGAIGGYFIYPELKSHYYQRKNNYVGLMASVLVISGGSVFFVMKADADTGRTVQQIMEDFSQHEQVALTGFESHQFSTPESIEKNVITVYERGLKQLDTIMQMPLNDMAIKQMDRTRTYMNSRITYFRYVAKASQQEGSPFADSAAIWLKKSEEALNAIYAP